MQLSCTYIRTEARNVSERRRCSRRCHLLIPDIFRKNANASSAQSPPSCVCSLPILDSSQTSPPMMHPSLPSVLEEVYIPHSQRANVKWIIKLKSVMRDIGMHVWLNGVSFTSVTIYMFTYICILTMNVFISYITRPIVLLFLWEYIPHISWTSQQTDMLILWFGIFRANALEKAWRGGIPAPLPLSFTCCILSGFKLRCIIAMSVAKQ